MAFPSWFSRLTSSSKHISKLLHKSQSSNHHHSHPSLLNSNSHQKNKPPFPWPTSLLPLAIAVSAASFGLDSQRNTTYCDSSDGSRIGGKDSTEVVSKGTPREVPKEFIDELKAICQDNMTLDYDDRYFHGKPQNSFHKAVNIPDVVVFPRSEEEIAKIVTTCNNYKVPIVPYGGATSVEGHTLTPSCGVCIDMALMKCRTSVSTAPGVLVSPPKTVSLFRCSPRRLFEWKKKLNLNGRHFPILQWIQLQKPTCSEFPRLIFL